MQAGLSLCWSHIPHFRKSHVAAHLFILQGVVITDGRSMNPAQTKIEADNARTNHIGMIAIGVGNGVDVNELHNIADDPDASNTFQVSNYDQLDGIVSSIVNRACQGMDYTGLRVTKIITEYDQEIPQSQSADKPMAPLGRATH